MRKLIPWRDAPTSYAQQLHPRHYLNDYLEMINREGLLCCRCCQALSPIFRAIQFSWLVSTVSIKEHATRRGQNANGLTIRPCRGERPFAPTVLAGL